MELPHRPRPLPARDEEEGKREGEGSRLGGLLRKTKERQRLGEIGDGEMETEQAGPGEIWMERRPVGARN